MTWYRQPGITIASYNGDECLLIRRLLIVVKMVIHVIN